MELGPLLEKAKPSSWMRELLYPSLAGTAGWLVYEFIGLMKTQPERAWSILQSWGPGFVITIILIPVLASFLSSVLESQRENTVSARESAGALAKLAEAVSQLTNRDDRERQEMQLLIGVGNSKMEQILDEQRRQNRALERIEDHVGVNHPKPEEVEE